MFASKFDDAEVVSKCMSGHLKSLLEYLSEADNSTQLVMSSYGERMLSRGETQISKATITATQF